MSTTDKANNMSNNKQTENNQTEGILLPEELNFEQFSVTQPRKKKDSSRTTSFLLQNVMPI